MSQEISPQELAGRLASGERISLIDVRTPAEFESVHADCAVNIPLDTLSDEKVLHQSKGQSVAFICKGGSRSMRACKVFSSPALSVKGGTDGWIAAGLPVVRGEGVISLERQVRITAGALVLLGVVLSITVDQTFLLISALIGAGLVFAGVTDWCGMGMLLARMPWNSPRGASSCSVDHVSNK